MKRKNEARQGKGFTLVELLVVVAIIALLVSILLPTLSRAKELTKRAICGTNLKGIGSSAFIYANDFNDCFPVAPAVMYTGGSTYDKWGGKTDGTWRTTAPTTSDDTVSVTASQWIFVREDYCGVNFFLCPSAKNKADDFKDSSGNQKSLDDLYDFMSRDNISYSFQMPYGMYLVRGTSNSGIAYAADKNPFFDDTNDTGSRVDDPDPAEDDPSNNSNNHGKDGQNVLYIDTHVSWEESANVGISDDHIYTRYNSAVGGAEGNRKIGIAVNSWAIKENDDSVLTP